MKSMFRQMLVAFLAAFAVVALASASASAALPEFHGAKFPVTFTGTSGSVTLRERYGGSYICVGSSITGEIVGPKELAKVVIKFKENAVSGDCHGFCEQPGVKGGWETKELKGRIGYLSKQSKLVGLLLEPVAQPVAKCEQLGVGPTTIQGSIIGQIGPVLRSSKAYELRFAQLNGVQELTRFEGEEVTHNLERVYPGQTHELGLRDILKLTMSQQVEILA